MTATCQPQKLSVARPKFVVLAAGHLEKARFLHGTFDAFTVSTECVVGGDSHSSS